VGTPRQLADDGALSRFIQRDGIAFDAQTLTIHVKAHD
jgi:iron complex transport system ATP-binding protein